MNISAAEFKARCLKLMDTVAESHEPLVITKRGKPLVKLVPIVEDAPKSMFGYMKGTLTIHGDIMAPIDEAWSAESGEEDELYDGLLDKEK
jgi:prevent-host-death family protein